MADADTGYGIDFLRGTGSPLVYATIGEVTDATPPAITRNVTEATHSKSPGGFEEFISSGFRDAGEAKITIQFNDVDALDNLYADIKLDTPVAYRFAFPDGTHWDFSGFITDITPTTPMKERMTCALTVKLTGQSAFLV